MNVGSHLRIGAVIAPSLVLFAACAHRAKPSPAPGIPADSGAVKTASGGQHERDRTGATQSLEVGDVKGDPATRVEQLIQGRFAGVQVVRLQNGGFAIRIRGASSFTGGTEPLYVVDGVALPPAPGGALIGVDPRDIERIEVLKDASSTSIYGVRGANGVILIKTKRGREHSAASPPARLLR